MQTVYLQFDDQRLPLILNDPRYEDQGRRLVESGLLDYTRTPAQERYTRAFLQHKDILGDHLYTLFLIQDDQVKGVISVDYQDPTPSITNFTLDRSLRGKGVGRALLEAVLDMLRQSGYSRVNLITTANLYSAIALYTRLGFVTEGHGRWSADIGMQKIYMHKDLL